MAIHHITPILILALSWATSVQGVVASKPVKTQQEQEAWLVQLADKRFTQWDHNHNGILELEEVDREVENHSVRGREAAVMVCLRRHLASKDNQPRLSREELLALFRDRAFEKSVEAAAKKLETIDRALFLPTDPDLATFHQGRLGDCYLLSVIAAEAHRSPAALRGMIRPVVTGGFEVVFGNGQKIKVEFITDSELLLGARMDSNHGSWLAVLEKAYGIIRQHTRAKKENKPLNSREVVPVETLSGGDTRPIISLLTGHQAASQPLNKSGKREQLHTLLVDLTKKRRLICLSVHNDNHPPGIVNKHAYALMAYDGQLRKATVFNPWGNTFTPKGMPGLTNGYTTQHGLFSVPLDEVQQVFTALSYETDKALPK
jgi:hypothetical protein